MVPAWRLVDMLIAGDMVEKRKKQAEEVEARAKLIEDSDLPEFTGDDFFSALQNES